MATVTKDFRIKSGLVVEGTTGTINGSAILTEASTEFLQDTIGGMVASNTESGISVEYDDTSAKLNFNVNDPTITISGDVDGNAVMTNLGDTTINVTLDTVNSNVGSFGGQTKIPTFTVNGKGLLTAAGEVDVATNLSIAGDTGTDTVSLLTDTLTFEGGTGITSTISNNKVKVDIDSTVATLSDQQTLTNKVLGTNVDLGANLDAGTYRITNLGAPDQSTDAATKAYVDAAVEGLHVHEAARVAVNGNISIANGLENGDTAGGVTLATGNRVLLKDQTNAAENGIYVVQVSGQALRATDFDTATEVDSGDFVFVSEGTYANTGWVQTLKPATIGTDPLQFTQFSGAGTFTAGTGLDLNGTEFVLDLSEVDTSTLPEGTNLYYTDERVDDRVDGLLVAGTGISKTYNDNDNTLTLALDFSEFSTTDVAEGTKLFFTDQRAVDALEAVVPNFTAIDINDVAKEVAVSGIPTAGNPTAVLQWNSDTFPSLKAIVMFRTSSHTEISEILLTMDSSNNFAITEYGVVGTNGTLGSIAPEYLGNQLSALKATTINSGTTVTIKATLLNPYTG
jgi:hypothetical protein